MERRSLLLKYKLHHLLFWMMVFALWYYLRYQDYPTREIALEITLLKVADLALMVYLTNYLLVPGLLYKKNYLSFIAAFSVMIFASGFVKVGVMAAIMHQPGWFGLPGNLKTRLYENVISDFFLVTTGAAFKLIFDYLRMQQRLTEIAKEKAETELNFLKSQINPHFLFNSLNAVYFLIHKDNHGAREALHTFSEMLRYQLYEMNGDKIPIEKEINYLKDYVDLQQLRKDEKYSVEFNCAAAVNGFTIEPLLLVPFVENAFKHISHYNDRTNFIKVDMGRENGTFTFLVANSKEDQPLNGTAAGIGMQNVKRRLELLYPGKYELHIEDSKTDFVIQLKLRV